jgi:hypothetical protein
MAVKTLKVNSLRKSVKETMAPNKHKVHEQLRMPWNLSFVQVTYYCKESEIRNHFNGENI